jgi:hypothetical protein
MHSRILSSVTATCGLGLLSLAAWLAATGGWTSASAEETATVPSEIVIGDARLGEDELVARVEVRNPSRRPLRVVGMSIC